MFENGKLRLSNMCDFFDLGIEKQQRHPETVNFGAVVADFCYSAVLEC